MIQVTITETTGTKDQMVELLRNIASQIEEGKSEGYYPRWAIDGEEEEEIEFDESETAYVDKLKSRVVEVPELIGVDNELFKKVVLELKENEGTLTAIKFVKEKQGWGLLEAKTFVEQL